MIIKYKEYCKNNGCMGHNRESWKDFICWWEKQYPDKIKKTKAGNGTHVDIGEYHFQATGSWSLYIYRNNDAPNGYTVGITVSYHNMDSLEILDDMLVINELMALK